MSARRANDETVLLRELHESSLRQETLLRSILRALGNADRESEAHLIEAIHNVKGSQGFLAVDILLDAEATENESLKNAIVDVVGQLNTRKLGERLAAAEGESLNGLTVRRLRNTRDGCLWKICESETPQHS